LSPLTWAKNSNQIGSLTIDLNTSFNINDLRNATERLGAHRANMTTSNTAISEAPRETGWYWVRPSSGSENWVPAKYLAEVRCWYSIAFGGISDRGLIEIGDEIVRK
jgi:hypothetical protein